MFKFFIERNYSIYHPTVDRKTNFKVVSKDGSTNGFTIIDVATAWNEKGCPLTVALLESNVYGEEWMMVVRLRNHLTCYHREIIKDEDMPKTGVLILPDDIIIDNAYNPLLEEMADEMPELEFEIWADDEINY